MIQRRAALGLLAIALTLPSTSLLAEETLADLRWERDAIASRLDRVKADSTDAANFRHQLAQLNARIARMLPSAK